MERFFALLALCLFLPASALAFNLTPYEIPESENAHVSPQGNGLTLIHKPSYDLRYPDEARLSHNSQITERITLPYDPDWLTRHDPFVASDGSLCMIGYTHSPDNPEVSSAYTLYRVENGALTDAQPIQGSPTYLRRIGNRFIGLREESGLLVTLLLYGEDNELKHELVLPSFHGRIQSAEADGDATLVMLALWDGEKQGFEQNMLTLYIDADGQILWQNQHIWAKPGTQVNYNQVFPDGQGGAFLLGSAAESYKIKSLRRIDRHGQIVWTRELRADKAIIDIDAILPSGKADTVICIGTIIANSRGLFDTYSMEMGLDGSGHVLDIRDFSARGDYNFRCATDSSGSAYAVSDSAVFQDHYHVPCVAVPLDALPEAKDPGIEIY